MAPKMNVAYVEKDIALEHLREIRYNGITTIDMLYSNGKVNFMVHQSSFSMEVSEALLIMFTFFKSANARNNQKIYITIYCGNGENGNFVKTDAWSQNFRREKTISLEAYEILEKILFESGENRECFAHIFLVLDWCLMKRTENCVNTKINNIHFNGEYLVFELAKSKGHQKGSKHLGPWRVYANPSKMWLCPVLSSSWYLFFYTDVFNGDVPIFERISQYTQYATQLTKIVKQLDTQLKILGFKAGYLWYHSYCKGVATMVAVGYTM